MDLNEVNHGQNFNSQPVESSSHGEYHLIATPFVKGKISDHDFLIVDQLLIQLSKLQNVDLVDTIFWAICFKYLHVKR